MAEVRREAHRTTPKRPPPCRTPRRSTADAPYTPNDRNTAPDPRSPRQLKRVGPRHIHRRTPLLGHTTLKHTRASPLPPLDSSRIRACFAVGVTWYHRAAPLTSPSSHRHQTLSHTTCMDTKLLETQLTTLAFSSPGRIGTSTRASIEKPQLGRIGSST